MYVCIYISIYVWLAVCVFVCVCVRVCVRVRVRVCVRAGYGPTIGHGYHSDGQTLACRRMHCESRPELNQNSAEQLGGVRREYSNEKMSRTQAEAARAQRSSLHLLCASELSFLNLIRFVAAPSARPFRKINFV